MHLPGQCRMSCMRRHRYPERRSCLPPFCIVHHIMAFTLLYDGTICHTITMRFCKKWKRGMFVELDYKKLGKRIKEQRLKQHLTQEKLQFG